MEAAQWSATPGAYFNGLKAANGGAPVYKAHPGLACIAITDHAGGKWFFEQPDTVLDRQVRLLIVEIKNRADAWWKRGS